MDAHEWDAFAADYAAIQRESTLPIETDVVAALASRLPLASMTVADIAAGSGRYAKPLAARAQAVLLYDWSAQMLQEASRWLTGVDNVAFQHADWHALPARPLADCVFVSQLPTLEAVELPQLAALSRRWVVINTQIEQRDSLQQQAAAVTGWQVPPVYQAEPQRAAAYQAWLTAQPQAFHRQDFTYTREAPTTVTETLQSFARPFSLSDAVAVATELGLSHPQAPTTTTLTYRFCLLDWQTKPVA